MTLIDEAAAGASPKVAKCLAASVTTRTNGVNACTDGIRRGDAEWIYSAPSRNGLKSRREDLVHRVCAQPIGPVGRIKIAISIEWDRSRCPPGLRGLGRSGPRFEPSSVSKRWLLSTNPKEMGSLYLLVAYEAGVDGTLFSMLVRTELALPFVSRVYNVLITAHAFLMIFFLIMPALLGGFTNLLVPIQIGSAEMALPAWFEQSYRYRDRRGDEVPVSSGRIRGSRWPMLAM